MSLLDTIKQGISVISNPSQSSVLAGGAVGAFSAEVNNLRKQAQADLGTFGVNLAPGYQSAIQEFLSPVTSLLKGSPSNPIPASANGTIFGFSLSTVAVVAVVAFVGLVLLVARAAR